MRELPDILDRRALAPMGVVVTALLAAWGGVRVALAPMASPPDGAWAMPLWLELVAVELPVFLALVQIGLIVGRQTPTNGTEKAEWAGAGIADAIGIGLLIGMWTTGRADVAGVARLALLGATWLALWSGVAGFRRGRSWTALTTMVAIPAVGLLAWAAVHPVLPGDGAGKAVDTLTVGAVMLTLLSTTLGGIVWAGVVQEARPLARTWSGAAVLASGAGLALLALAWESGMMSAWDAVKLWLLLAAWIAALTSAGIRLRRYGPGTAVAAVSLVALVLLAFPAVAGPLHRAIEKPGTTTAERVIGTAAYGCPTLGAIDAVSDSIRFSWTQAANRVMYSLTPLGQDAPWPRVAWGWQVGMLTAVALLLARYR